MKLKKQTKLGKEMVKAGFPYCYSKKGWEKHCLSCLRNYKNYIKLIKFKEKEIK
jgi:hypothetical protein